MQKPHHFQRRILVAVSGLSPAILTETLYALAVKSDPVFIPTEIHLITTQEGKVRAVNTLIKGNKAALPALCKEYNLANIKFDESTIHVISDDEGHPLNDIRYPEDNERAGDFIVGVIQTITDDEHAAVHVSIAGGRKTMGYYIGYALSLFGRQQDRLSHVLVDADYENCFDFRYPTKSSLIMANRDGKPVDASEANVYLAEIPFVRMLDLIGSKHFKKLPIVAGKASFAGMVERIQGASLPKSLIIDIKTHEVTASGITFKWETDIQLLSFYLFALEQTVLKAQTLIQPFDDGAGNQEKNTGYAQAFLKWYGSLVGCSSRVDNAEHSLREGMDRGFFTEKISRLNTILKENLGETLAKQYQISSVKRGSGHYNIDLEPFQLTLLDNGDRCAR